MPGLCSKYCPATNYIIKTTMSLIFPQLMYSCKETGLYVHSRRRDVLAIPTVALSISI